MKKTKTILVIAFAFLLMILNIGTVNAANKRIEIVEPKKQFLFKNSFEETVAKLKHEITTSDLVQGDLTVNLIFDNSVNTEIFYVIDNGTSINNYKNNVFESLSLLTADLFEELGSRVKIGSVISTSGENTIKALTTTVTETTDNLEELEDITSAGTGDIYSAITEANNNFSEDEANKIIILITASMPEFNETNVNSFVTLGNSVNLITLTIDLNNNANMTNIFGSEATPKTGTLINATTANYQTKITENIQEDVIGTLPNLKNNVSILMPFATYIINNFDIELVTTSEATMDETTKAITWTLGNVESNTIKTLQYKLSLKSAVDESILNTPLTLTDAPTISFGETVIPRTDVNNCSPIIKVLQEAIDNPKTGVINYIICGAILAAIGGTTYLVASKKKRFDTL